MSYSLVRGSGAGRRLFVRDGFFDRLLDEARVGQVVVGKRRGRSADEPRDQVDGDVLRPERGAARDGLHELGTECTRRVERRAGDGTEDQDDVDHRAADHETRELLRRAAVDDAEDGEEQQTCAGSLGERCPQVVRSPPRATPAPAFPASVSVAITEPGPTRTRAAVPRTSAKNLCRIEYIAVKPPR